MKKITPEEHPVSLTEVLHNSKTNRERKTQIIVETLDVPATYVATQAACVYSFTAATEREIVQDATKKLCFFGFNYDTEETYGLPDGNIITVRAKRLHCAEVLLQPIFIGKGACGLHDTFFIMKCDVDIFKNLYAVVVLSGGTTIFQGVGEHTQDVRIDRFGSTHDEIKVATPIRNGLEDSSCLPSAFSGF